MRPGIDTGSTTIPEEELDDELDELEEELEEELDDELEDELDELEDELVDGVSTAPPPLTELPPQATSPHDKATIVYVFIILFILPIYDPPK